MSTYAMMHVLTNKMAYAWASTTSRSGLIYGIQLAAGGYTLVCSVILYISISTPTLGYLIMIAAVCVDQLSILTSLIRSLESLH